MIIMVIMIRKVMTLILFACDFQVENAMKALLLSLLAVWEYVIQLLQFAQLFLYWNLCIVWYVAWGIYIYIIYIIYEINITVIFQDDGSTRRPNERVRYRREAIVYDRGDRQHWPRLAWKYERTTITNNKKKKNNNKYKSK